MGKNTIYHYFLGFGPSVHARFERGGHGEWNPDVEDKSYQFLFESNLALTNNDYVVAKERTDFQFAKRIELDLESYIKETEREEDISTKWVIRDKGGQPKLYHEEYNTYLDDLLENTRRYAVETGNTFFYNPEEDRALQRMQDMLVRKESTAVAYAVHHPDGIRYIPLMKWSQDGTHIVSTYVDVGKIIDKDIPRTDADSIIASLGTRLGGSVQVEGDTDKYTYLVFNNSTEITVSHIKEEAQLYAVRSTIQQFRNAPLMTDVRLRTNTFHNITQLRRGKAEPHPSGTFQTQTNVPIRTHVRNSGPDVMQGNPSRLITPARPSTERNNAWTMFDAFRIVVEKRKHEPQHTTIPIENTILDNKTDQLEKNLSTVPKESFGATISPIIEVLNDSADTYQPPLVHGGIQRNDMSVNRLEDSNLYDDYVRQLQQWSLLLDEGTVLSFLFLEEMMKPEGVMIVADDQVRVVDTEEHEVELEIQTISDLIGSIILAENEIEKQLSSIQETIAFIDSADVSPFIVSGILWNLSERTMLETGAFPTEQMFEALNDERIDAIITVWTTIVQLSWFWMPDIIKNTDPSLPSKRETPFPKHIRQSRSDIFMSDSSETYPNKSYSASEGAVLACIYLLYVHRLIKKLEMLEDLLRKQPVMMDEGETRMHTSLLLSIIWYMSQIREQGTAGYLGGAAPLVQLTQRTLFPVSGILYVYEKAKRPYSTYIQPFLIA